MELVAVPRRRRRRGMKVRGEKEAVVAGGVGGEAAAGRWGEEAVCECVGEAAMGEAVLLGKLGDCDQMLQRREGIGGGAEEEEEARHEGSGERRRHRLREVEVGRRQRADGERRRPANALGRPRWGDAALLGEVGGLRSNVAAREGIGGGTEEEEARHEGFRGEKEVAVAGGGVVVGGGECGGREGEECGPRVGPTFSTRSRRTTYMQIWMIDL